MRYLCLIYTEKKKLDTMSFGVRWALAGEARGYHTELKGRGHFVAAQALPPAGTATTVRVRSSRVSATEGPVNEASGQLAGFVLIEARDLNEAIQVASRMPEARVGSIEVRPIRESSPQDR